MSSFVRSPWLWFALLILGLGNLVYWLGRADSSPVILEGETMGTYWQVRFLGDADEAGHAGLQVAIASVLQEISLQMSNWREDSELSEFNRSPRGKWVRLSQPLWELLLLSRNLSNSTEGAFDVTAGRLTDLWGFGPSARRPEPPDEQEIRRELLYTGWRKLQLKEGHFARRMDSFSVDLSAVAKGHAVDRVSDLMLSLGYSDHLVDIGGEVKVSGYRSREDSTPWQVAIARPPQTPLRIERRDRAAIAWSLATSGDYRNFFQWQGRRYAHVLDLSTGTPVEKSLASASVLHTECAVADAVATALLVMGKEKALDWADKNNFAVLLQERRQTDSGEASWQLHASPAWRAIFITEGLDN